MGVETNAFSEEMTFIPTEMLQEMKQASIERKWRGKILVEFAPFSFRNIKESGQEKTDYAEDGNSFKAEKYMDVMEWMYVDPKGKYAKKGNAEKSEAIKYNNFIYVNCCNVTGGDLLTASVDTSGTHTRHLALMERLEFAVRTLKDYFERLERVCYINSGGSVRLYLSAYYPVDMLLFGFQKALGFSVEKGLLEHSVTERSQNIGDEDVYRYDLYEGFLEKVKNNSNLKLMANWFKEHHWKFHLETCEVHQMYNLSGTFWTEQGTLNRRKREMIKLMQLLHKPTREFEKAYEDGQGLFYKDSSMYDSYVRSWRSQKKPLLFEDRTNDYVELEDDISLSKGEFRNNESDAFITIQVHYKMLYPAIEYEGVFYTYFGLRDKIKQERREFLEKQHKDNDLGKVKKQAEEMKRSAEREEKKLYDESEAEADIIHNKIDELHNRKKKGSPEQKAWQKSYMESHVSSTEESNEVKDMELIEYRGEMLNEAQLNQKLDELVDDFNKKSNEIYKKYDKANKLLKKVKKLEWDKWLTVIQILGAVACLALTIICPPAGGAAMLISSAVSIGCESYKWITDESNKNWGSHVFSIAMDVISLAFVPLVGIINKSAKLTQVGYTVGRGIQEAGHVTKAGAVETVTKAAGTVETGTKAAGAGETGAKAAGAVDDGVITVEEMEKANSMGKLGKATEGVVGAADDVGKTRKTMEGGTKYSNGVEELYSPGFSDETKRIIETPVDLSKSQQARRIAIPQKDLARIEQKVFAIDPNTIRKFYKTETELVTGINGKNYLSSPSYGKRMLNLRNLATKGGYDFLRKGSPVNVTFTGKELFEGSGLGRVMNAFGYGEVYNLLKTNKLLGIKPPTGISVFTTSYVLVNSSLNALKVESMVDGIAYISDWQLSHEIKSSTDNNFLQEVKEIEID